MTSVAGQPESGPTAPAAKPRGLRLALAFGAFLISAVFCWAFVTVGVLVAAPLGFVALAWLVSASLFGTCATGSPRGRKLGAGLLLSFWFALSVFMAIPAGFLCVIGAVSVWGLLVLLCWRIGRRMKPRRPWLSRRALLAAEAIALLPGIAMGLFLGMDEAPRQFPHLAVERPAVAEADNGFLVLEEMRGRLPLDKDPAFKRLLGWAPEEAAEESPAEGTPEWTGEARDVLQKWQACLDGLDRILARPRLSAAAAGRAPEPSLLRDEPWLLYERLLAHLKRLQSQVLLADGRTGEAMTAADETVQFGLRIQSDPDDMYPWLVGNSCIEIGTEQVRKAACAVLADSKLLQAEVSRMPKEEELRSGFRAALAGDLENNRAEIAALADWSAGGFVNAGSDEETKRALRWMGVLVRDPARPFIKVNASANLIGARLNEVAAHLDRFQPALASEPPSFEGLGAVASRLGWGRFLRNPVGVLLADMSSGGSDGHLYALYFRLVADVRLTRVFLALRCYQLENGSLPKTLDELAPKYIPEVPADPFSEKPFIYEPDAAPPRLLSVGPDQRPDAAGAEEKDDIVLELAFPSP
jgi:hypothetical protein